jgi:VanZ family protein
VANTFQHERRRWLTAYAPLIIWTLITLGLGSGAASMNETSRFIGPLLKLLFPAADADTLYLLHAAIRKMAHIFQYGVLCILALRAFSAYRRQVVLALCYVGVVAMADEINQSFDPTRTATPIDVLLDLFGGIVGVLIYRSLSRWWTRRQVRDFPVPGPHE